MLIFPQRGKRLSLEIAVGGLVLEQKIKGLLHTYRGAGREERSSNCRSATPRPAELLRDVYIPAVFHRATILYRRPLRPTLLVAAERLKVSAQHFTLTGARGFISRHIRWNIRVVRPYRKTTLVVLTLYADNKRLLHAENIAVKFT